MIPQRRSQEIQRLLRQEDEMSLQRGKKLLQSWLRQEPGNWEPHMLMAIAHSTEGNTKRAQSFFATAKQLAPSEPDVWINSSIFHQSQGEHEFALHEASHAAMLSGDRNVMHTIRAYRQAGYSLIELLRLEEARVVLQRVELAGFFEVENFVLLVLTGRMQEAIERTARKNSGWGDANTAGSVKMPKESIFSRISPLWVFACEATLEHDPDVVLRCITLPPTDLQPGTPAYIGWWCNKVNEAEWADGVRETLHIAATPGWMDAILESLREPPEKRISWKELRG